MEYNQKNKNIDKNFAKLDCGTVTMSIDGVITLVIEVASICVGWYIII